MTPSSTITLRSGNSIPVLGLGTWKLDDAAETTVAALEIGYPMIDTSSDYGTQPGIGEGLRRSGADRKDFYLVTKVEETDDAFDRTRQNLEEPQLRHVDMMLIHRPPEDGVGVDLWQGLIRARDAGLTRDIGVSNYSAAQIQELIDATGEVPAVNQIEWSPYGHSDEMLDFARRHQIVIQAYSPLTRSERLDGDVIDEIAERHDKSPAQVILRWNLQRGTVPLPKANSPEHLKENLDIFDFELSDDEMQAISGLNEHYSALGELPYV